MADTTAWLSASEGGAGDSLLSSATFPWDDGGAAVPADGGTVAAGAAVGGTVAAGTKGEGMGPCIGVEGAEAPYCNPPETNNGGEGGLKRRY